MIDFCQKTTVSGCGGGTRVFVALVVAFEVGHRYGKGRGGARTRVSLAVVASFEKEHGVGATYSFVAYLRYVFIEYAFIS